MSTLKPLPQNQTDNPPLDPTLYSRSDVLKPQIFLLEGHKITILGA